MRFGFLHEVILLVKSEAKVGVCARKIWDGGG
jgi:hypothetical protein